MVMKRLTVRKLYLGVAHRPEIPVFQLFQQARLEAYRRYGKQGLHATPKPLSLRAMTQAGAGGATPMMAQYLALKEEAGDCLLF